MSVRPTTLQHTVRQLKLVIPGGAITYYLGTLHEFWRITQAGATWGQTAAFGALGLGLTTIVLFIYVLLTPWIKGVEPNVRRLSLMSHFLLIDKYGTVPFMAGVRDLVFGDTCK
ncbi:hypothetical protein D9615_004334 [Tricholomella constricta]|uniref:Uncharacterized protein n=1 Tax=Tricholomella constricta TaxID=117010 RepID=A0A8H5HF38_9AGAR|nr:hypothetical protein D9615_004334 [Tricholomella constricta]